MIEVKHACVKQCYFTKSETVNYSQIAGLALPRYYSGAILSILGVLIYQIGCLVGYLVFIGYTMYDAFPTLASYKIWILTLAPICLLLSCINQLQKLAIVLGLLFSGINLIGSTAPTAPVTLHATGSIVVLMIPLNSSCFSQISNSKRIKRWCACQQLITRYHLGENRDNLPSTTTNASHSYTSRYRSVLERREVEYLNKT